MPTAIQWTEQRTNTDLHFVVSTGHDRVLGSKLFLVIGLINLLILAHSNTFTQQDTSIDKLDLARVYLGVMITDDDWNGYVMAHFFGYSPHIVALTLYNKIRFDVRIRWYQNELSYLFVFYLIILWLLLWWISQTGLGCACLVVYWFSLDDATTAKVTNSTHSCKDIYLKAVPSHLTFVIVYVFERHQRWLWTLSRV